LLYPLVILIIGTLAGLAFNGYYRTQQAAEDLTLQNLTHSLNHSNQILTETLHYQTENLQILASFIADQSHETLSPILVDQLNHVSDKTERPLYLTYPNGAQLEIQHAPQKLTIVKLESGKQFKSYYTPDNLPLANTELTEVMPNEQSKSALDWNTLFEKVPVNNSLVQFSEYIWIHYHLQQGKNDFILTTRLDSVNLAKKLQLAIESSEYSQIFLTNNNQLILQTEGAKHLSQADFEEVLSSPELINLQANTSLTSENMLTLYLSTPHHRMAESINRNLTDTLIQTLLMLIAISLFIFVITYRVTSPLKILTDQTDKLRDQRFDEIEEERFVIKEYQKIEDALIALKNRYQAINKYIPTQLIKKLNESDLDLSIHGDTKPLNLINININQFTRLTRSLSADDIAHFLSLYQSVLYDILTEKGAIIDQINGDHIVAYWGAPVSHHNDPDLACLAALAVNKALAKLNEQFIEEDYPQFEHRISIVSGDTVVGNFGSAERMVYSVIGSKVDDLQIINKLNKRYSTKTIICEATFQAVKDSFFTRKLDTIKTPFGEDKTPIYELICRKNDPRVHQEIAFVSQYESALDFILMKDYVQAEAAFSQLMEAYPDDEATLYQIGLIFQIKQNHTH